MSKKSEPPEVADEITIVRAYAHGLAEIVNRALSQYETADVGVDVSPSTLSIEYLFHGVGHLSAIDVETLGRINEGYVSAEDGMPSIAVEIPACERHPKDVCVEFEVSFSKKDWKKMGLKTWNEIEKELVKAEKK